MFDDRYSYPNVIMGGSGTGWMKTAQQMRDNPFRNTFLPGARNSTISGMNQPLYQSSNINEERTTMKMQTDNKFR